MLLGILSPSKKMINEPHNKDIIKYAKEKGIIVCRFLFKDINWNKKTLIGVGLDGNIREFRFPDIIYIRNYIVKRKEASETLLKNFRLFINRPDLMNTINNKFKTYTILKKNGIGNKGNIRQPETLLYTRKNVKKLLKKYNALFFKPINGTYGFGVFSLKKQNSGYLIHYKTEKISVKEEELFSAIEKTMKKNQTYIVQEAVNLKKYKGRVFDIRGTTAKNGKGKFMNIVIIVRVGAKRKVVSNVHAGGLDVPEYKKILKELYPEKHKKIIQDIKNTLIRVAGIFDSLGIMGTDIIIDKMGRLYVIEVNNSPAIYSFTHVPVSQNKKIAKCIVDYAVYLYRQITNC